ncbi:hypothetical protein TRVL_10291 [Trypanosoma vivax]|nr:hypothetical protein TRVL_10291 [Trypanosoma vivax]
MCRRVSSPKHIARLPKQACAFHFGCYSHFLFLPPFSYWSFIAPLLCLLRLSFRLLLLLPLHVACQSLPKRSATHTSLPGVHQNVFNFLLCFYMCAMPPRFATAFIARP